MVSRRRCPVCGSKQWHKEPSSGLIACSEGHILQSYRNETNEAEDVGNHMMRKRDLKSNRKKKERKSGTNPQLYHGSRGRYLYFQCQQLILRKQIAALTKLWDLSKEFEMVCRDLWALHLSLLPDPPPSEPFFDLKPSSNLDEDQLTGAKNKNRTDSKSRPQSPETRANSPLSSDSPSSSSSSEDDDPPNNKDFGDEGGREGETGNDMQERDTEVEDEDPELVELMRENSESEDDDDELDEGDDSNREESRPKRGHNAYEGPANNLAVLMVALWTLRIPVMYRDLIRHIELYELPYLDPVRLLPKDMVLHLTKHNVQALSPSHAPKPLTLHALTSRLAKQLYNSYMILTPEANVTPLLWRIIQGMGGTPMLYAMTKRLAQRLSLPLALHQSLVPKLQAKSPQMHKSDNVPIEVSLLAAVIVVLKMVYGLDGERRSPSCSNDPAFALPCIEDYMGSVKQAADADSRIFNSEKSISMDGVTDELLDRYLAFCERILLRPGEDQEQMFANYFPLDLTPEHSPEKSVSQRRPMAQGPSSVMTPRRPGEKYTMYNPRDIFGSAAKEYEIIVQRGSDLVGVPKDYIDGVVEKFEHRKLWRKLVSG
ncbi:hypothetical protein BDP27DRAFT_1283456 [Rhodocollybia butyracea]|uniref:RRN7-type domain-containing protein n=1 Tax=Rhodocollybia butyracea TaxID=206335 RepID=A0A9P5Q8Q5_9AGAR|nr:hypothetical protein BDP27DRAFT_1283456 [Rhodocollybia butyracea]